MVTLALALALTLTYNKADIPRLHTILSAIGPAQAAAEP